MSVPLHAVQHIRRVRGGSQAHLLRASDGAYYVTKFQANPQGTRVLANEMFASRLGRWLGLPVPNFEVLEVGESLIEHTPELRFEVAGHSVKCPAGRHAGSLYPVDPLNDSVYDYLPESFFEKVKNRKDFARVLVLDKWLGNSDGRQVIFSKKFNGRSYTATFVDQGYCFNALEWNFPDLALHGVYYRNYVYTHVEGWNDFEPVLTKAEEADIIDIWRCAEVIPPEWYEGRTSELERLVETVYSRRDLIRQLIAAFRGSSRNPFPNWQAPCQMTLPAMAAAG
jgi:HipA-like protein